LVNRTAERAVNSWICKEFFDGEIEKDFCVAGDTDSIMFTLADVVKKLKPNSPVDFLDAFCEKGIEPVLEKTFEQFARDTNAYDNRMGMKREVIASSAIWQKKKRYLMNVLDNEGVRYNNPKLKIKGIEAIKSSTPKVCRNEFKRVFPILLSGNITQIQQEIQNFRIKFFGMEPHEIGMPRGASNITKWKGTGTDLYKKGVPYHVRGALIYNNLLKKHGLTRKYQPLRNGDRLYITYLRKDNPTGENLISFPMFLPVEFGLHQYIDHETQFNKTYLEPLTLILDPCGWKAEHEASLESLFG
jgi:DNA polymerase elongation subunit (family B)